MEELTIQEINNFTIDDLYFARVIKYVSYDSLRILKESTYFDRLTIEEQRCFGTIKSIDTIPFEGIYINDTVIFVSTRLGNVIVYQNRCIGKVLDNSFFYKTPVTLFSKKKKVSFGYKYDMLTLQQDFSEEINSYECFINEKFNFNSERKLN
jgi:hypothetical protein